VALSIVLHLFLSMAVQRFCTIQTCDTCFSFHPFLVHILDKSSAGYLYGQLPYMVLRPARLKSTITVVMPRQTEVLPQMGEEGIYPEIESKRKQNMLQHQYQTKRLLQL